MQQYFSAGVRHLILWHPRRSGDRVTRREFITLIGGVALARPLAVRAQQGERVRQLGVLMGFAESDPVGRSLIAGFEGGLDDLGWMRGRNLRLYYRFANGVRERTQAFAKELVELKPDAILAGNTPGVVALMRESRTIPIVFASVSDPVDTGLVPSLAHPGGNVTGFTGFVYSLAGKWLEILKAIVPHITRVALMFNPETAPFAQNYISSLKAAGSVLGVEASSAPVHEVAEIEHAIVAQARQPSSSIIVMPDNFANVNRARIISLMARHRVPAIYPFRSMAAEGGLVFYGADTLDLYRRAASYIDRILKGANPGELPVQQPTKFELVVNLKAAKTLGITVPPALLTRADEVIE
jgi:putative ABC transport system substrate-binding protein